MTTTQELLERPVRLTRQEIDDAVKDANWQELRVSLLGTTTAFKLSRCDNWLQLNNSSERSIIQVMNYLNALKRGGLL